MQASEIITPHHHLNNVEQLAEGRFGNVYRAEHKDWGIVAYKELKATALKTEFRFVSVVFGRRTDVAFTVGLSLCLFTHVSQ